MKIISKIKDYYDYLTGMYGVDPKAILDRTKYTVLTGFSNNSFVRLYICGFIYEGYFRDDRFYWGEDLALIANAKPKWEWRERDKNKSNDFVLVSHVSYGTTHSHYISKVPYKDKNNINKREKLPILYEERRNEFTSVILRDLQIAYFLRPQQIYLMLNDWLLQVEDVPNKQTDKEKIISNGFDIKKSFRH